MPLLGIEDNADEDAQIQEKRRALEKRKQMRQFQSRKQAAAPKKPARKLQPPVRRPTKTAGTRRIVRSKPVKKPQLTTTTATAVAQATAVAEPPAPVPPVAQATGGTPKKVTKAKPKAKPKVVVAETVPVAPSLPAAPSPPTKESKLSLLYEQFVEVLMYHMWIGWTPESPVAYTDKEMAIYKQCYDQFKQEMTAFRVDYLREIVASVAYAPNADIRHPVLQWIIAMFNEPEVHFEDAKAAQAAIEGQGHAVKKTPVACIWCGRNFSKGPIKHMYRMKINPKDGTAPIAAYVCKNEGNFLGMVHNVSNFETLVQGAVQKVFDENLPQMEPETPWSEVFQALVGERGKKTVQKHTATGMTVARLKKPISKWPLKMSKKNNDPPMVFVVTQWREILNQAQEVLAELRKYNKDQYGIVIPPHDLDPNPAPDPAPRPEDEEQDSQEEEEEEEEEMEEEEYPDEYE